MTYYENSIEHLLEELHRVHLIVSLAFKKWKIQYSESANGFQGLCISEKEVDAILMAPPFDPNADLRSDLEFKEIEQLRKEIKRKKTESLNKGKELRLHILSEIFHLKPFEIDALLIGLAAELDLQYEKLYSYMQNDVTKKRPTVDFVIKLLCFSIEERFRAREFFSSASPLIKNRILYLLGDSLDEKIPLLSRSIKVDERIVSFLLGSDIIDPRTGIFSSIIEPERTFDDLILYENNKKMLIELIDLWSGLKELPVFLFHGPYGTGKKITAEAACKKLGTPLLIVDSKALKGSEHIQTLNGILREALLQNSSLYFEGFDALWEKDAGVNMTRLLQGLDDFPNWVFLSGELAWEPPGVLKNHRFINVTFPLPSFALRKKLWEFFLNGNVCYDVNISDFASKFKFSGGQIRDAIFTARNLAMTKKSGEPKLSMDDLYRGCKAQSNKNLSAFAKKIEPHYTWEDIIIPDDTKEQLKEVSGYIKFKGTVYTNWGFDKKLSLGKGLNVLFSGPSGTGKTMAAEIVSKDAGLDLYKIDLSCVVSKYIGETEKNLRNIFKEAETSNAILFFDEADAIFGKRSEVKDSHDRYANIEINYLLQKMEEYEGIVILASNLSNNIDDAFLRRMQFKIDFPTPDNKLREQIWKNVFPEETPVGEDVDHTFLAKFKISGGNIKNIALSSAFLAADDSKVVKMEHIIRATKREFQKIGKTCTQEDFGGYYDLVK